MLDDACSFLALVVENKSRETEKDGKAKWTLKQILSGEATRHKATISELFAMSNSEVFDN